MIRNLSQKDQLHLGMSQVWLGSFLRLSAKHSNTLDWKIDNWTSDLLRQTANLLQGWELDGLTPRHVEDIDIDSIEALIKNRGNKMFVASSDKHNKFLNVEFDEAIGAPYAYVSIWDSEHSNMPSLSFIANPSNVSLIRFEEIFDQFMLIDSPDKFKNFQYHLENISW